MRFILGPFSDYVYKILGGFEKMSVFVHVQFIKTVQAGRWVKKWQNFVHVVVEWPLKLSCCFFSVKLFGFLKADAGMAGLARLNLNGFLKILTFVSSQAPLIYLTPQFRFLATSVFLLFYLLYKELVSKNSKLLFQ